MYYLLFNSLSGSAKKSIKSISKYCKKRKIESKLFSILDQNIVDEVLNVAKDTDRIVILGGDGTLNVFVQNPRVKNAIARIMLYKAGSGNDFAREHKGKLIDITDEVKNTPYFMIDDKRVNFLNGVGMGIDACVCDEVNKNPDAGYFKTAVNIFKTFKPFSVDLTVDGKLNHFDDVYFFVCMNGKNIGGGMKVAPNAVRNDGILDVYIIKGKNYKQIVLLFPLIYLGLHTLAKKHVFHLRGKEIEALASVSLPVQADGEVTRDVTRFKVCDHTK